MAGTRSSARQAEKNASSPQSTTKTNGTKRKADETSSPSSAKKRGRPSKEQKTLEETISKDDGQDEQMKDNEGVSDEKVEQELQAEEETEEKKNGKNQEETEPEKPTEEKRDKNALEQVKADEREEGKTSKIEDAKDVKTDGNDTKEKAVEEDKKREEAQPSNILEKGIIYFFTRGRVGVDDPDSVQDLQRSFFVLRPLPAGAKLTEGAIQDVGNNRLIALPKKVWPKSGKDRFMAFVEKAKTSMNQLKETFFQGSEYSTATTGTRHQAGVTLVGEGVYAMTRTGGGQGTTHLAWQLTIPSEVGEVQKDIGLDAKSSLILSVKNPESSAPANAQLPQTAEYPKDFIEEFAGRGWLPAQPKHLDYDNASFLLIGEDFDSSSNLDPAPKDEKKEEKETPQEELEKLENEDEHRVEKLKGDDTIFTDLGISSKEYGLKTTW